MWISGNLLEIKRIADDQHTHRLLMPRVPNEREICHPMHPARTFKCSRKVLDWHDGGKCMSLRPR